MQLCRSSVSNYKLSIYFPSITRWRSGGGLKVFKHILSPEINRDPMQRNNKGGDGTKDDKIMKLRKLFGNRRGRIIL